MTEDSPSVPALTAILGCVGLESSLEFTVEPQEWQVFIGTFHLGGS